MYFGNTRNIESEAVITQNELTQDGSLSPKPLINCSDEKNEEMQNKK